MLKGLPLHMQTGCALGYVPPAAVEHGAYRFLLNALDIVLQGLARLKVCATPVHGLAGRGQVQDSVVKPLSPSIMNMAWIRMFSNSRTFPG